MMRVKRCSSLGVIVSGLFRNWTLLLELVKRDFLARYRGSFLGVVWSLLNPLLMLAVYTAVFSVAFKARWAGMEANKLAFAIILFSGMIVHSLFADCVNRAPVLILQHVNFVKKVVFPLELLPVVTVLSALIHFLISFMVLCLFCLVVGFPIQTSVILSPLVIAPLLLMLLGFTWFLSALGVYLKDLSQFASFLTSISLFLAPVFYATESLPEKFQRLLHWNPITLPILQLRDVLLFGKPMAWGAWGISGIIGVMVATFGYAAFQKMRRGFADVL